jgi:hypothetical protein
MHQYNEVSENMIGLFYNNIEESKIDEFENMLSVILNNLNESEGLQ